MWKFMPGVSNPRAGTSKSSRKRDCKNEYEKTKRHRSYRKEWERQFEWLSFDEEMGKMFYDMCVTAGVTGADRGQKQNSFFTGSDTFKLETLNAHSTSQNHRLAVERERAKSAAPGISPAEVMLKGMNTSVVNRLKHSTEKVRARRRMRASEIHMRTTKKLKTVVRRAT